MEFLNFMYNVLEKNMVFISRTFSIGHFLAIENHLFNDEFILERPS